MTAVVEVSEVTFSYGNELALENVSLTVEAGEFLGVIGPNGSGKTTLLHLMLGLLEPDSGQVRLFGTDASAFDAGERIGYVAQRATDRSGAMPATVREVVAMGRIAHIGTGRLQPRDRDAINEAVERVDITDLLDRRIDSLSGGQRQRALIARALATEPDLLALDEPTVGVDADSRDRFYGLLRELNEQGITVILIEHDIDVLTSHVDTIACLNRQLYHHGDVHAFLESDALTEAYGHEHTIIGHEHP